MILEIILRIIRSLQSIIMHVIEAYPNCILDRSQLHVKSFWRVLFAFMMFHDKWVKSRFECQGQMGSFNKIDRFQTGQNQYNNGDLNMMIWNKVFFSLDGILFSFRGPFRHLRLHFDKLKLDRLTTLLHWPQLTALGYQKRIHEKGITTIPDHHITLSHLIHPHFNPYT